MEVQPEGVPEFVVFKNGKKIESLLEENPIKAKKLFDKYNIDSQPAIQSNAQINTNKPIDSSRSNVVQQNPQSNSNKTIDASRSNMVQQNNLNKSNQLYVDNRVKNNTNSGLVMENALTRAKQQHEKRYNTDLNRSFLTDSDKKFYERNLSVNRQLNKVDMIETTQQFLHGE